MFGSQQAIINFSLFSFLPVIVILFYVYKRDRFPEPPRTVFITLILGFGITLPIGFLIPIVEGFIENIRWGVEAKHFYQAFVRAAFLEETMKFLVIIIYCLHLDKFDEPMDALVYGVAASLGFAAYENWEYVLYAFGSGGTQGASDVAWIRAFTAVPLHALCGVFMGFFLMDAIFEKEHAKLNLFLSLFFPICLHGFYNYLIMSESFAIKNYWIFILVGIFLIRAFFIFKKERKLQFAKNEEAVHNKILPITNDIVLTILSSGFLVVASSYFLNKYLY